MKPLLTILVVLLALSLFKVFYLDRPEEKSEDSTSSTSSTEASESKTSGMPVDVYIAREINKGSTVYASGTLIPNEEVDLKSEVSGRLTKLSINEGGFVRKGQLVAKLDDADLMSQLKRLKYEEELAAQTEARQGKLLQINAISKEEYDLAVNKVNTLSADKELLEVMLEKTSVRSPFNGRMGFKNISEGAYITPAVVITNIVQINPVKLDFGVPEKYSNQIKVGQSINFTIDGSNEDFSARIIAIDPKVDENLRTLMIRAKADNTSGKLLPGMFISVQIPLGEAKSIMIPSEAIIPILKGKKVYVMKEAKAQEVIIQTGLRTDIEVQVESGLEVGDSVIVSALMSVKNQMPVTLRNVIK